MASRMMLCALSAAAVTLGATTLSAHASPAAFACSDAAWSEAVNRATSACGGGGGSATVVGECVGTVVVVHEIYCQD